MVKWILKAAYIPLIWILWENVIQYIFFENEDIKNYNWISKEIWIYSGLTILVNERWWKHLSWAWTLMIFLLWKEPENSLWANEMCPPVHSSQIGLFLSSARPCEFITLVSQWSTCDSAIHRLHYQFGFDTFQGLHILFNKFLYSLDLGSVRAHPLVEISWETLAHVSTLVLEFTSPIGLMKPEFLCLSLNWSHRET